MLTVHEIKELTGLSRVQVDHLISTYGLRPDEGNLPNGVRRYYRKWFAITLSVAAELRRAGMGWETITEVSRSLHVPAATFPLPDEFAPAEHRLKGVAEVFGPKAFLVVFYGAVGPYGIRQTIDGELVREWHAEGANISTLARWLEGADFEASAIVINLTELIAKVERMIPAES